MPITWSYQPVNAIARLAASGAKWVAILLRLENPR